MVSTLFTVEHGHCVICRATTEDLYILTLASNKKPVLEPKPPANHAGICLECIEQVAADLAGMALRLRLERIGSVVRKSRTTACDCGHALESFHDLRGCKVLGCDCKVSHAKVQSIYPHTPAQSIHPGQMIHG